MSAYDEVEDLMAGERCSASETTFPYCGMVLRLTDDRTAILAYTKDGNVELWPFRPRARQLS